MIMGWYVSTLEICGMKVRSLMFSQNIATKCCFTQMCWIEIGGSYQYMTLDLNMSLRKTLLAFQPRKIMRVMAMKSDTYMFYFIIYILRYHFFIVIFDCLIILFNFHVMMLEMESWLLVTVFKQFEFVNYQFDVKCGSCL